MTTLGNAAPSVSEQAHSQSSRGSSRGRRGGRGGGGRGANRSRATHLHPNGGESSNAGEASSAAAEGGSGRRARRGGRGGTSARGRNGEQTTPQASTDPLADDSAAGQQGQGGAARGGGPSSRRRTFGGQLSSSATKQDATPSPTTHNATNSSSAPRPAPVEYSDLRSRLIAELSAGGYECAICYSTVTTKAAVWSCNQCWTVLHLNCVQKWAKSSIKSAEELNAMQEDPAIRNRKGTWRCPGCQYARESAPSQYLCWCTRTPNPQGGKGALPHGCGARCGTAGPGCTHGGCAEQCHPGPCVKCAVTVSQTCFCGAKTIPTRCSQLSTLGAAERGQIQLGISCGGTCNKLLGCGTHTCSKPCHAGPCEQCDERVEAKCYCGRNHKDMQCGEGSRRLSRPAGGGGEEWEGLWSCEQSCERKFDCGIHACKLPCHPLTAEVKTCPKSPAIVTSCPCGATPIADRANCTDPIPTCSSICAKVFKCGHTCPQKCHEGPCPPCLVPSSTPCRCGETKTTLPCYERQREEKEASQEVLCNTSCKALRSCGKHECRRQCCPLYFQAKSKSKTRPSRFELEEQDPAGFHTCSVPCQKPLSCGAQNHNCPMTCHRGACPPCLQASFTEQTCHCGRTTLEPPVPCGAQIVCNFPCTRPPPACGHPKVPHSCHEGERCPPCVFLTDRQCHCGKNIVQNVPCSRSKVSCPAPCGCLLQCGYHRCLKVCSTPDECEPCSQLCGKPRKCGHPCTRPCHAPASCPDTDPCETTIMISCPCGHLQQRAPCGGNPSRNLKCNDACAIAQRNAKLAEAFGLTSSEAASLSAPAAYPPSLIAFYRFSADQRRFADEVFTALTDFIRSPRHGLVLPPSKSAARTTFIIDLANVFKLHTELVETENARSVSVRRRQDAKVPNPTLAEAAAAATEGVPRGTGGGAASLGQLRREAPTTEPQYNSIVLENLFGHDEASLRSILTPAVRGCPFSLRWIGDEDVLITTLIPSRLLGCKPDIQNLVRPGGDFTPTAVKLSHVDATGAVTAREGGIRRRAAPMVGGAAKGWAAVASGRAAAPSPSLPTRSAWGLHPIGAATSASAPVSGSSTPSGSMAKLNPQATPFVRASGSGSSTPLASRSPARDPVALALPQHEVEVVPPEVVPDDWEDDVSK